MKRLLSTLLIAALALFALPASLSAAAAAKALTPALLAEGDDDDEEEEPYVEPPFTVYIDIDKPEAVRVVIVHDIKPGEQEVAVTAGENTVTVDPGDNYIKVINKDGYGFKSFDDLDRNVSYLYYDYQTAPVTIRKRVNTGDTEGIINDGHHYQVRMVDFSQIEAYTLDIDVDNAALVRTKVGTGSNFTSGSNRDIILQNGVNHITYLATDKYLHLSPVAFDPFYHVTLNGEDLNPVDMLNYRISLNGAATKDAKVVVTAVTPEPERPLAFTLTVDDINSVEFVTRRPSGKQERDNLTDGDNTLNFYDGESFEIWSPEARKCTLNGKNVKYTSVAGKGYYDIKPANGDVLVLEYLEPASTSFTLFIDDVSKVRSFSDYTDEEGVDIVSGLNTIELYEEGHVFRLRTVDNVKPFSFTLDGNEIEFKNNKYFDFIPGYGSKAVLYFEEPVVAEYSLKVRFTDPTTTDAVRFSQINDEDVDFQSFLDGMTLVEGTEVWLSYDRDKYTINDITVNGASQRPFTGALNFFMNEDTEVVFDLSVPEVELTIDVDCADNVIVYTGNSLSDANVVPLRNGRNAVSLPPRTGFFTVAPAEGAVIKSVAKTDGSREYDADDNGEYRVYVVSGLGITIVSAKVEFDESFALIVEGEMAEGVLATAKRETSFAAGYNVVAFNKDYDEAVLFLTEPAPAAVYLNREPLALDADYEAWFFVPEDRDVVRIYIDAEPATHSVAFDVEDGLDGAFTVVRDAMQDVDHKAGASDELHATRYSVVPAEGRSLKVTLTDMMSEARGEATEIEAEDGMHSFVIDGDMTVTIASDGASDAIDSIDFDAAPAGKVYNLQGIVVLDDAAKLHTLPAGFYILGGRKIVVGTAR